VRATVGYSKATCPLDRVKQQFSAERLNQLWGSDFGTRKGSNNVEEPEGISGLPVPQLCARNGEKRPCRRRQGGRRRGERGLS